MSSPHPQLGAGGPGGAPPCLGQGDVGWLSPPPRVGAVLRRGAARETLARWCLEPGSWLPPEGSRVGAWKALAGLWRGGSGGGH